jgi:hypothetical protein
MERSGHIHHKFLFHKEAMSFVGVSFYPVAVICVNKKNKWLFSRSITYMAIYLPYILIEYPISYHFKKNTPSLWLCLFKTLPHFRSTKKTFENSTHWDKTQRGNIVLIIMATSRPPFGQKIVPIFSFFLFGPGYFNYDKPLLWESPEGAGKTTKLKKSQTARESFLWKIKIIRCLHS